MYLKRLTLENFRSFRGRHAFEFLPGLNCIVGDNNCGKSSLFEAITYLMGIGRSDDTQTCNNADGQMREQRLVLRVERSPVQRTIKQSGRDVQLDGKKLPVWNPATCQFENPAGIDALIKGLIDIEPVWADTTPGDVADFGTTKILGKIIDAQIKGFQNTETWKAFRDAHQAAFSEGAESLAGLMDAVAKKIAAVVP